MCDCLVVQGATQRVAGITVLIVQQISRGQLKICLIQIQPSGRKCVCSMSHPGMDRQRVHAGVPFRLADMMTRADSLYQTRRQYQKCIATHISQLSDMQDLLHASGQHAVLLIIQAMDVADRKIRRQLMTLRLLQDVRLVSNWTTIMISATTSRI